MNWDERYARGEHANDEPSPLLRDAVTIFSQRSSRARARQPVALDLACGAGRHALYLAECGFAVIAVDKSTVAVDIARQNAAIRNLDVDLRVADLETGEFRLNAHSFDLICDFFYLQRDLFAPIRDALRPGGLFVAAIHMFDSNPAVKEMNPDFLLHTDELKTEFENCEILHYRETDGFDEATQKPTRRAAELIARMRA
jgi:tellurite methyltransferase